MSKFLYELAKLIAKAHEAILRLNDNFEFYLSDKELHFVVIGILGMILIAIVYPIFKYLAKRGRYFALTWIYVFTVIIVITFAIEIGQKATNTGAMEFMDIVMGIAGFLAMVVAYLIIHWIGKGIISLFTRKRENNNEK